LRRRVGSQACNRSTPVFLHQRPIRRYYVSVVGKDGKSEGMIT
jgi:hypothetical protein